MKNIINIINNEYKMIIENLSLRDLAISVYSLAKNNNGFFKSEKQAELLKREIDYNDGVIGSNEMYGNQATVFAEYDNEGITRIYTHSSKTNRNLNKFTRINNDIYIANQERLKNSREENLKNVKQGIIQTIKDNIKIKEDEIKQIESLINNDNKKIFDTLLLNLKKELKNYQIELDNTNK